MGYAVLHLEKAKRNKTIAQIESKNLNKLAPFIFMITIPLVLSVLPILQLVY